MVDSTTDRSPPEEDRKFKEMARPEAEGDPGRAGAVREAMPQILASCAKNMLLLGIGMTISFPTVVIAALLRSSPGAAHGGHQVPEDPYGLTFDAGQASWFGGLMIICQPFGSVISGMLLEPLGRKRAMLLVNAPHLLGWLLLALAQAQSMLFAATVIMGLTMGFMEAPIITYVGEISTPKLRGALTSMAGISVTLGYFIQYLLGSLVPWRTAAWVSLSLPVITVLAITLVPESPIWLVSKGRVRDAERALCWLRGWVEPCAVQTELAELVRYNEEMTRTKGGARAGEAPPINSKESNGIGNVAYVPDADEGKEIAASDNTVTAKAGESNHSNNADVPKPSFMDGIRAVGRRETVKPLLLVMLLFVFHHWTGCTGLRPFMVPVFRQFGLPIEAHWVTVLSAVLGIAGTVVCTLAVAWCGKRWLALSSVAGLAVICYTLGGYHMAMTSAEAQAQAGVISRQQEASWLPLVLFIALFFFHSFGIGPIPWMLLSEVFPYQGRAMATGIAGALSYVLGFSAVKTFLDLQSLMGLSGVFFLNGSMAVVGLVVMYFYLPETEGRTLQDIEATYGKKKKTTNDQPHVVPHAASCPARCVCHRKRSSIFGLTFTLSPFHLSE